MEHFKTLLQQKLGNQVKVEIYPSGSLYSQADEIQAIQQNDVQFIAPAPGPLSTEFPKLSVFDLPYLFKSPAMIKDVINDTAISGPILKSPEQKNVLIMSVWLNGWRMVSATKKITNVSQMKGLKIRVPPGQNYVDTFKDMGADVTTINWTEVPTSLQEGVIQAVESTPNATYGAKLYKLAKYITDTDHILDIYLVTTNLQWFNSLPKNVQQAITQAMNETTQWNWQQTTSQNNTALQKMEAGGAVFTKLTTAQLAQFQAADAPVLKTFNPIVGANVISQIQQIGQKYPWQRP